MNNNIDRYSRILEAQMANKVDSSESHDFLNLLPIVMKVASHTIGFDIIGTATDEEIAEVEREVRGKIRDEKLQSLLEGNDYISKKLEDYPEYKQIRKKGLNPLPTPSCNLMYMNFKYNSEND
jgi:hypothetical protein